MCSYKYKFKKHPLEDAPCIYPAFYEAYADQFAQTKVLPVDSDGYCIFHSRDKERKEENGFTEKFMELISATTAICKKPDSPKWAFNFSGFYFNQSESQP